MRGADTGHRMSPFLLERMPWCHLDTAGIIRFVHPGTEHHGDGDARHAVCANDMANIRATIERLLAAQGGLDGWAEDGGRAPGR